jgi:hypothetical protein
MTEPTMTKDRAIQVLQYLATERADTDLDGDEKIALTTILSLMETHVLVPTWAVPALKDAAQAGIYYRKTLVGLDHTTPFTESKLRIIKGWETVVELLKEANPNG